MCLFEGPEEHLCGAPRRCLPLPFCRSRLDTEGGARPTAKAERGLQPPGQVPWWDLVASSVLPALCWANSPAETLHPTVRAAPSGYPAR